MNAPRKVAIVGAAASPVGRWAPSDQDDDALFELDVLGPLVIAALAEAGLDRSAVDTAAFVTPSPSTRQLGFSTYMAARLGLRCNGSVSEVSALGVSGGLAFDQALADVALGRSETALALGISYQTNAPLPVVMEHSLRAVGDVDFQSPFGLTPISWYAFDAARYMHETGITREQIAQIAVKSRRHAMANELAQFRKELTLEEVLAQRMIVSPLGLFEVPSVADGAICLVLASEEAARASGKPYVTVEGRGYHHEGYHQIGGKPHDMTAFPAARQAARAALDTAGVSLGDIDLAELYAPCTITEVLVSEAIGFCAKGQGALDAAAGVTSLGGRIPINTSGGCLSRGHPPALTGLYGLLELREQLLGRCGARQVEGARLAMHCCESGNYNAALIHVLEGPK
ncbi:MAG: thiolase family protein [Novosphingobium sp.]|jgi:acetyl-CoA C-acetyltransferase|nr:thiolase family protein [Novosphingobium sp.]